MGQALYRKYRPKSLADVAGQEHITTTLNQAVDKQQISHAYLFTGPRGVGKTSVARILAHLVNDLPYTDDSSHIDIIEIDAASNRRIDEIRELRERVFVSPNQLKYKVYIIDEVHMLTREAFNALLKTLEEPPAHVIFILATTDLNKLPETIISRTQHYSFRPVSPEVIAERLTSIAKQEKIKIDPQAIKLLSQHGDGSLRDSISLLDQVKNRADNITELVIRELLGLPPDEALSNLIELIFTHAKPADLMLTLNGLYEAGYQADVIAHQMSQLLRQRLIDGTGNNQLIINLLADLIKVPASFEPRQYLEITILKAAYQAQPVVTATQTIGPSPEPTVSDTKPPKPKKTAAAKVTPSTKSASAPIPKSDNELWSAILNTTKQQHNTLYGILRMARPDFQGDTLMLTFAFPFHQKQLSDQHNRAIIEGIAGELSGHPITLDCILDRSMKLPKATPSHKPADLPAPAASPESNSLSTISNIFNGAELLES